MKLGMCDVTEPRPPGFVLYDGFKFADNQAITSGSDGSVYYEEQVAAAAWLISTDKDHHMGACFLLSSVNKVQAYRSELEGVFRTLSHLEELNITPSEVVHWCDNEQSVRNTRERPYHASAMIASDADLVLAIHHLKSVLPYPVDCRHVYGHQDDDKRKAEREEKTRKQKEKQAKKAMLSPEPVQDLSAAEESVIELFSLRNPEEEPPEEERKGVSGAPRVYPPEVQINMACDIMASDTSKAHLESGLNASKPLLTLPYAGSKAMLRLGNR